MGRGRGKFAGIVIVVLFLLISGMLLRHFVFPVIDGSSPARFERSFVRALQRTANWQMSRAEILKGLEKLRQEEYFRLVDGPDGKPFESLEAMLDGRSGKAFEADVTFLLDQSWNFDKLGRQIETSIAAGDWDAAYAACQDLRERSRGLHGEGMEMLLAAFNRGREAAYPAQLAVSLGVPGRSSRDYHSVVCTFTNRGDQTIVNGVYQVDWTAPDMEVLSVGPTWLGRVVPPTSWRRMEAPRTLRTFRLAPGESREVELIARPLRTDPEGLARTPTVQVLAVAVE